MKIKDSSEISGLRPEPRASAPTRDVRQERVSLKGSHDVSSAVSSARASSSLNRAARLEAVEKSVRSGQYKPEPAKTAEALVASVELDAQLKRMSGQ